MVQQEKTKFYIAFPLSALKNFIFISPKNVFVNRTALMHVNGEDVISNRLSILFNSKSALNKRLPVPATEHKAHRPPNAKNPQPPTPTISKALSSKVPATSKSSSTYSKVPSFRAPMTTAHLKSLSYFKTLSLRRRFSTVHPDNIVASATKVVGQTKGDAKMSAVKIVPAPPILHVTPGQADTDTNFKASNSNSRIANGVDGNSSDDLSNPFSVDLEDNFDPKTSFHLMQQGGYSDSHSHSHIHRLSIGLDGDSESKAQLLLYDSAVTEQPFTLPSDNLEISISSNHLNYDNVGPLLKSPSPSLDFVDPSMEDCLFTDTGTHNNLDFLNSLVAIYDVNRSAPPEAWDQVNAASPKTANKQARKKKRRKKTVTRMKLEVGEWEP